MSAQPSVSTQSSEQALPVQAIETYVQAHLQQYIQELSELCAIDSGSYNKPGIDEVAHYLAGRMRGLGMDTMLFEHEEHGNDVMGIIRGHGQGNVLLLGHIDTVYPIGTAAMRPVQVEGDTIFGPGVYDMKGSILLAIYAIEALLAMEFREFGEIRLLCVSDEEISDRHSQEIIRKACLGSHGVLVLEGARENGDIVSARKGGCWYKLQAHGHSAHAGVEPEKGANAIVELAHQIVQFQSLHGCREGVTINIGRITGGIATNVVPDYAEAFIDSRFLHNEDKIAIEQRWQEMLQQKLIAGVELTLTSDPDYRDPMTCTKENLRLIYAAQEIARQLGFTINHAATGGISDANYASGYGFPTLDGLGPIGGLDHSPNEYILMSSIAPRAALLAGLIVSIGTQDFASQV